MIVYPKIEPFNALFSAVGCVCFHNDEFLLLKRNDDKSYPNHWGVPTGKINNNETPIQAIVRELYEETQIVLSTDRLNIVDTFYVVADEMSFRYILYFTKFDTLPNIIINSLEHKEYRWIHFDTIDNLDLVPDVKETIQVTLELRKNKIPVQLNLFTNEPETYPDTSFKLNEYISKFSGLDKQFVNNKKWVASFGAPGSGKTTTLKGFYNNNPQFNLISDNKKILTQETRLKRYLIKAVKEGKWLYYFFFQMEILPERYKQSFNAPDYSLVDETILSTLAYSTSLYRLGWLTKDEYDTFYVNFQFYLNFFPAPSKILYTYCRTETMINRINKRNRQLEKSYTFKYLDALNRGFKEVAKILSDIGYDVVYIDTDNNSIDKVNEYVSNIILKLWT